MSPSEFYGCPNERCPPTAVVITSYPNLYNPFVTAEPNFPSTFPYTSSLNPAALDLLTDVHIIRLEGGVWDARRALRTLYVQVLLLLLLLLLLYRPQLLTDLSPCAQQLLRAGQLFIRRANTESLTARRGVRPSLCAVRYQWLSVDGRGLPVFESYVLRVQLLLC